MQLMVVDVLKGLGLHGKKTDTLLNAPTFRREIIAALRCLIPCHKIRAAPTSHFFLFAFCVCRKIGVSAACGYGESSWSVK